jgi:hypothetical protein
MPTTALYDLADRFYTLAPWEILEEIDLIRLIHPDTGESGCISIMGRQGQHQCLALYLGDEALHRFNLMQEDDPDDPAVPELDSLGLILETRQLQASFGVRAELRADELALIKKHGRKYRGDNWPMFRSFKPGYAPGPPDDAEILWLTIALEQMLTVFPSLTSDGSSTFRQTAEGFETLTRVFENGAWRSKWTEHDGRTHEWATPEPSELLLEKIRRQEKLVEIDCHFQLLTTPVGRPGTAVFPYLAISVEPESGFILGVELLSCEKQSHAELIASVPDVFLKQWDKAGIRPASIRVSTITTYSMLEITADRLNTPMRRAGRLPSIDRVMRELPL